MSTDKEKIDWYPREFLRLTEQFLAELREDPRVKALIIRPASEDPMARLQDPAPWEEWLKSKSKDTYYTLQRLRARGNEIWISGSNDPALQAQFTTSVEMEYKLSIWAAKQYLRQKL